MICIILRHVKLLLTTTHSEKKCSNLILSPYYFYCRKTFLRKFFVLVFYMIYRRAGHFCITNTVQANYYKMWKKNEICRIIFAFVLPIFNSFRTWTKFRKYLVCIFSRLFKQGSSSTQRRSENWCEEKSTVKKSLRAI